MLIIPVDEEQIWPPLIMVDDISFKCQLLLFSRSYRYYLLLLEMSSLVENDVAEWNRFFDHDWSNISDVSNISEMDTTMVDMEMKMFITSYLDYFLFLLFLIKGVD